MSASATQSLQAAGIKRTTNIKDVDHIGLIACGGRLPFILAQAASEVSIPVSAFAINGITKPELADHVDRIHWMDLGDLSKFIKECHTEDIHHVLMAGRVPHNAIWRYRGFDKRSLKLLGRMVTRKADSILGSVVEELAREGIEVLDHPLLLGRCMPKKGLMTPKRPLSRREKKDIEFGFPIAREIAGMDIGQTVVVKDLAVVAVESLEGTDETIRRAGEIADGGIVVIKVAKPHQDSRFDIPVVGPGTIRSIRETGGGVLAMMARQTLFFDQAETIEMAQKAKIGIQVI